MKFLYYENLELYGITLLNAGLFMVFADQVTYIHIQSRVDLSPNKVLKISSLLPGQFLPSENTQTDRQIIKKRHYDRKYMYTHITVTMHKN